MKTFLCGLSAFVIAVHVAAGLPAANPVKLAGTARLDLWADEPVREIDGGRLLVGNGSLERMNWRPEAERPRGYTVNLSVTHRAWREFTIQFTPAADGHVTLMLMGAWEEASPGVLYRQEILWDALKTDGATLVNGSFEEGNDGRAGWQSRGGVVEAAADSVTAVDGRRYARTWHNQTLSAILKVRGKVPVTLRLFARAVSPEGYHEMARITDRNTPAHQAARQYMRGVNISNYLEAPPGQDWGAHYTAADFDHIRKEGFDHVRLPVGWHHYAGPAPQFQLRDEIFSKADFLVNSAVERGLNVIVNLHHFDQFTDDPAANTEKFYAIWRQVAAHYASSGTGVAFELLNEPHGAATTAMMNPIYAETIRQIRTSNPQRTIFVGPSRWNQVSELPSLRLPDDEQNVIVSVHCYDPFYFTHQGASWSGPDTKITGIQFPGPPAAPLVPSSTAALSPHVRDWLHQYNTLPSDQNPCSPRAFRPQVAEAKEWSDYYGRPIHFGEFGSYEKADAASRASYYATFRQALDEANMGWAIWDWKAGFKFWDDKQGRPVPGMREALFGQTVK